MTAKLKTEQIPWVLNFECSALREKMLQLLPPMGPLTVAQQAAWNGRPLGVKFTSSEVKALLDGDSRLDDVVDKVRVDMSKGSWQSMVSSRQLRDDSSLKEAEFFCLHFSFGPERIVYLKCSQEKFGDFQFSRHQLAP